MKWAYLIFATEEEDVYGTNSREEALQWEENGALVVDCKMGSFVRGMLVGEAPEIQEDGEEGDEEEGEDEGEEE